MMNVPAVFPLPFFALISVGGDDAAAFLHSQLSNHIQALETHEACFATYNNPKGRVIANMLLIRRPDGFLLLTAADLAETLVRRLKMFVLRSKVNIGLCGTDVVFGQTGAADNDAEAPADALKFTYTEADGLLHISLNGGNRLIIGKPAAVSCTDGGENDWFAAEIRAGRPWVGRATSESCVAQMLNQHRLGAVHFKKGCYPGQEIIARAQYRGQVKRGLVLTRSNSPVAAGAAVHDDGGNEAGIIINQAADGGGFLQLAVLKHQAAQAALTADGSVLTVEKNWFEHADDGKEAT